MEPVDLPNPSKTRPNRKRRDHSEWLEKALEEGGSRKRRSKRISDPDFVFNTKMINQDQTQISPSSTQDMDTESTVSTSSDNTIASASLELNLDFKNMNHYEKFFKYKNEYKEYKIQQRTERINKRKSRVALEGPEEPPLSITRSLRNSSRVQKTLEMVNSSGPNHMENNKSNIDKIDIENIEHAPPLEKDKYCWYCHKEVIENRDSPNVDDKRCKSCYKVFHLRCHPMPSELEVEGWECKACIELRELKDNNLWAPYVEYLGYDKYIKQVRYIIDNAKKYPSAKEFLTPVNTLRFPDYRQYIAHPVDFQGIERRLKDGEYRSVDILFEDFKWMFHNSVIFNGTSSAITKDFRGLMKYLRMDLYDLDSCACCYIHAYTRPDAWFILPCPSPHLLVWAQLKGFPHWPAKVYDSQLEQRPGEILVKFFGDHARSWIPYEHIYLYSLDPPSSHTNIRTKKKQSMIPSLVEMETHVELLKKQFGEFKYPEQNVLIGKTVQERAVQLKSMIPSCPSCLLKQPCALRKAARVSESSERVPEPKASQDINDTTSKRSILCHLEERLQQGCSDSEESVKSSGKINKKTLPSKSNSKALRGVRCQLYFKVLQKNASKIQDERLENIKKLMNGRTQKKSTNSPVVENSTSVKESIQDDSEKTVTSPENHSSSLDPHASFDPNTEMNLNEKSNRDTHDNATEPSGTNHDCVAENKDHVTNETSTSETVPSQLEDKNKPLCTSIDDFIENHLSSSQQTCEWSETDKIPPILMPRDERIVPVSTPTIEKIPVSTPITEEIPVSTPITEEIPVSTPITEEIPVESSSKEEGNEENPKSMKTHKKKAIENKINKEKMLCNKSLKLKQRLFRYKNYGAQLFEFRKLSQVRNSETLKQKRNLTDSLKQKPLVAGDVSTYFDTSQVKIMDPVVVLNSLTIAEIKGLKSTVKYNKTPKNCSMTLRNRSKPVDSGFVPIEDTIRITSAIPCDRDNESAAGNAVNSVIDQVATGGLASDAEFEKLLEIRRQRPSSFRPKKELRRDSGGLAVGSSPGLPSTSSGKEEPDIHDSKDALWTHHMSQLMKFLETNPSMLSGKKGESMIADVEKLKKLAFFGEDPDEESKVIEDTKYSTALNSAELILYSEYAAEYELPELTSADYDTEYEDM